MQYLKITLGMHTPVLYGRRPPTLDGILASAVIAQQSLGGAINVVDLLQDYLAFETHPELAYPVPIASQMLVTPGWEPGRQTIVGSFVRKLRDDFLDIEYTRPIRGLMGRAIDGGWGARTYIKNTQSSYNAVLSREVIFFAVGDADRIQEALDGIDGIGTKRQVGFGTLIEGEKYTDSIATDEYPSDHPGLVNRAGEPIRPVPLVLWKNLSASLPGGDSMLLEESYFPPYFNTPKTRCWAPPAIKQVDSYD